MYINYGDVNFFEHGRLADTEHSDTEVQVLYCEPYADEEDLFLFADCTVDLTDSWIDWDAVNSFAGDIDTDDSSDTARAWRAIEAIDYYGVENFSSPYLGYQFHRAEIEERLKHYMIATDNLNITW